MQPESKAGTEAAESIHGGFGSWAGLLFYCAFSFLLLFLAIFVARDFMFIMIAGFFSVFGVAGIVMMVRNELVREKFGDLRLLVENPAPALGGRLKATLRLPPAARAAGALTAELRFFAVTYNEKTERSEALDWARKRSFPIHAGAVELAFDIPADLPHSND